MRLPRLTTVDSLAVELIVVALHLDLRLLVVPVAVQGDLKVTLIHAYLDTAGLGRRCCAIPVVTVGRDVGNALESHVFDSGRFRLITSVMSSDLELISLSFKQLRQLD